MTTPSACVLRLGGAEDAFPLGEGPVKRAGNVYGMS